MEELATTDVTPLWMQVFIYRDRSFSEKFCIRTDAAEFDPLVLTIDNQIIGTRERELHNRFSIPPSFDLFGYAAMIFKYKWLWRMSYTLESLIFRNYSNLS